MTLANSTTDVTFRGAGGITLVSDARGPEDGPPVVLLHGGGQTRHSWGTTAAQLATEGWRAYTVDARGHGDSEWSPEGDYRLDAFAGDVREIGRALRQPPVVVGASLGGVSSMVAIAETDPPNSIATALVLVEVAPRMERSGVDRIGEFMTARLEDGFASLDEVADAVAAYNPHRPRPTNLSGLRKNVRQRDDGRWVWHWDPRFVSGRFGSRDETRASLVDPSRLAAAARALTIPTLLVRGHLSDLLSEEGARELLELIPHARFVDVAGAGHMVAGDRNDLFNDAVVSFLREQ
jgi:pimeloyl-ACP methyl ester carboxylesterase